MDAVSPNDRRPGASRRMDGTDLVTVDARDRDKPAPGRLQSWWRSKIARWSTRRDPAERSFRYLARQIAADLPFGNGGKTILVSSPGTMSLINDTLVMFACYAREELGCRLLVIDGTFRDDGVSALLGHSGAPGVHDLLDGAERRVRDLIQPTERPGVFLLPAGRSSPHPLGPNDDAKIAAIFEEARGSFDYVLLEQASILTDSRYLSFTGHADLLLFIVEEGATSLPDLEQCEKLLRDHQISNVRLILAAGG